MFQDSKATFWVSPTLHFPFLDVDAAFSQLTSLTTEKCRGSGVKLIYCQSTNAALVEEALQKASAGCESSCGVVLTSGYLFFQLKCSLATLGVHGKCIKCELSTVPPPEGLGKNAAIAIICSSKPFHIANASSGWASLFGFSCDEMKGRSLKMLQGPASDAKDFDEVTEALRLCLPHEKTLRVYRKDGTEACVRLHMFPVQNPGAAKGKVMIAIEATIIANAKHSQERRRSVTSVRILPPVMRGPLSSC